MIFCNINLENAYLDSYLGLSRSKDISLYVFLFVSLFDCFKGKEGRRNVGKGIRCHGSAWFLWQGGEGTHGSMPWGEAASRLFPYVCNSLCAHRDLNQWGLLKHMPRTQSVVTLTAIILHVWRARNLAEWAVMGLETVGLNAFVSSSNQ